MYDVASVKILYAKANVDEDFPNQVVDEGLHHGASPLRLLLFNEGIQIADRTVFQDDVDFLIGYERVYISDYVGRVKTAHDFNFVEGLQANFLRNLRHVYHLDDVVLILKKIATLDI